MAYKEELGYMAYKEELEDKTKHREVYYFHAKRLSLL